MTVEHRVRHEYCISRHLHVYRRSGTPCTTRVLYVTSPACIPWKWNTVYDTSTVCHITYMYTVEVEHRVRHEYCISHHLHVYRGSGTPCTTRVLYVTSPTCIPWKWNTVYDTSSSIIFIICNRKAEELMSITGNKHNSAKLILLSDNMHTRHTHNKTYTY